MKEEMKKDVWLLQKRESNEKHQEKLEKQAQSICCYSLEWVHICFRSFSRATTFSHSFTASSFQIFRMHVSLFVMMCI